MSKTYNEKLQDPRWQKKRLEILNRDEWTCQTCSDTENTLHVHHRFYEKGKEPWEYNESALMTLCKDCHQDQTELMPECIETLNHSIKELFLASDIHEIGCAFHETASFYGPPHEALGSAIAWSIRNPELILNLYFEYLENKRKSYNETP